VRDERFVCNGVTRERTTDRSLLAYIN